MQALSNDQQIERIEGRMDRLDDRVDRLETKMDAGFTAVRTELGEVRGEARSDFRMLFGIQLTMLVAMILGFAGILFQLS